MKQYVDLVKHIMENGEIRGDRTGTGTKGVFGYQMRFDLSKGFPLVSVKRTWFKGVVHELLWFLRGETNIKYLVDNDVHIWDEWADEDGELGPVYGSQWRNWNYAGIDQIKDLIDQLERSPESRRHLITAWNPELIGVQALPPCHCLFQFYVSNGKLSCQLYQRSADVFLGVPFNIASYALLTHIIARRCGLEVGEFVHTLGDAHLYLNHMDQVEEMLKREPKEHLPILYFKDIGPSAQPWEYKYENIGLWGYDPHPTIKAEVSV